MPKKAAYTFDRLKGIYRDKESGRAVPQRQIKKWVQEAASKASGEMEKHARAFLRGSINEAEWAIRSADTIKNANRAAAMIAGGGRDSMTQADWGRAGTRVRDQLSHLMRFSGDVDRLGRAGLKEKADQFVRRASSYGDSVYVTHSDVESGRVERDETFETESNILDAEAEHCDDCLEQTDMGEVPVGTLIPIGDRECGPMCKCEIVYS